MGAEEVGQAAGDPSWSNHPAQWWRQQIRWRPWVRGGDRVSVGFGLEEVERSSGVCSSRDEAAGAAPATSSRRRWGPWREA